VLFDLFEAEDDDRKMRHGGSCLSVFTCSFKRPLSFSMVENAEEDNERK
jgi:hypothetical protein